MNAEFTDEGDVVIDPVAGSGSTLVASMQMNRKAYGFEIKKNFFNQANAWIETIESSNNMFSLGGYYNKKAQQNIFLEQTI